MRPMRLLLVLVVCASCASARDDAAPVVPSRELAVGGARIRGGGIRMDVEVGRSPTKKPIKAGTVVAKPNAVVTP
jgi:hypothetical protein